LARLLVLAALLAGCGASGEAPPPGAVARIGGQWVEKEAFDLYLRRTIGTEADELGSDVLSLLLDQFLEEEQLARLAVDRGLASAEDSRRRAVDRLLRSAEPPEPTDAEVESYYHAHVEELERPERVRLRQILVDDRATAERALEALRGGEDFVEVARSFSRDPDADSGGEQGELARDDLPPAFVEPIFRLEEGQVSDIVEAEYGFHIFQVTARLPAEVVPLAEVEHEIRQTLAGESADRRLAELLDEARDRYNTVVYEKNLPFSYRGRYAKEDA
jgi:parvulin-like peptidyl-prolyl isomerase